MSAQSEIRAISKAQTGRTCSARFPQSDAAALRALLTEMYGD